MNRAQRRQIHAVQRKTGGVLVEPAALENLQRAQRLLMAIVKEQGRVRVSNATLENLNEGDRITAKHGGEHMVVQYVAAPTEPQGETPA